MDATPDVIRNGRLKIVRPKPRCSADTTWVWGLAVLALQHQGGVGITTRLRAKPLRDAVTAWGLGCRV